MDIKDIKRHIDNVDVTIQVLSAMINERDCILSKGHEAEDWKEYAIMEAEKRALLRVRNIIIADLIQPNRTKC